MKQFDGFKKTGIDEEVENKIEKHCYKHCITPLNAVKLFPVLARRQILKRFLAHVELFKKTLHVPGDIAEFGVFRGFDLMTWANLLEAYCIGNRTKTVYGFDNWKGFTELSPEDGKPVDAVHKEVGSFSPADYYEELKSAIKIFDKDRFIPWKQRIKLIKGNIEDTVPKFVEDNPGVRFSLIHCDCDLYNPTNTILENLYSRLSKGGTIIFDEYAIPDWAGETHAVDDFFKYRGVEIRTFTWTNAPAGYVIKC